MTETKKKALLGTLSSLIALFSILLYFIGWIYRWAYFAYFSVNINALDFSFESFLFVPIQVAFGGPWISLRSITILLISFKLLSIALSFLFHSENRNQPDIKKTHSFQSKISQWIRKLSIVSFPKELARDIIIVLWILFTTFWMARYQGWEDAMSDAKVSSSLPFISLVANDESFPIGRDPSALDRKNSSEGLRIIGDNNWYEYIKDNDVNDSINIEDIKAWRLLLATENDLYIFVSLPSDAKAGERPLVVYMRKEKVEIQILSADAYKN